MPVDVSPSEIPVLLLFNMDPEWTAQEQEEVIRVSSQLDSAISASGHQTTLAKVTNADPDAVMAPYDPREFVVFNWCEGYPGVKHSEWLVAEYLESRDFAFTGASSSALALAQDKCRMKNFLDRAGIPTPGWKLFDTVPAGGWNRFPAIVKPAKEHCSEGIDRQAVVMTETELAGRVSYILEQYQQPALVEDFIDGRELHVSLWGNGRIDMLPPAEMEFSYFQDVRDHICSYEAKFVPESVYYQNIQTILPAPLSEDDLQKIEEVCKAAYQAIGCRDYARIDLRMQDGVLYVLDVNPNADISIDASTAAAAEYAGYSYGEFGSRLVRLAARRHPVWGVHS